MTDFQLDIPFCKLGEVQKRLEKLNRRAVKLCQPGLTFTDGEPFKVKVESGGWERWQLNVTITISGLVPRVNGWTFIARLEHTSAGNLISKAPVAHSEELSDSWRTASAVCDHCSKKRTRRDSFLLRNDAGELKQIGRNCLADFVRSTDAEHMVSVWAWLDSLKKEASEEWSDGGGSYVQDLREYVAHACRHTRVDGYAARGGTRDRICFTLGRKPIGLSESEWQGLMPTDEDWTKADSVIAWARESTDTSEFAHNLRVACANDWAPDRAHGLLACAPHCYDKALGIARERAKRESAPDAGYFGSVKERHDLTVTVVRTKFIESNFGPSRKLVVMRDPDGHEFTTFTSSESAEVDFSKHESWKVRATVKKHEEYQGRKVTYLTRCVFSAL